MHHVPVDFSNQWWSVAVWLGFVKSHTSLITVPHADSWMLILPRKIKYPAQNANRNQLPNMANRQFRENFKNVAISIALTTKHPTKATYVLNVNR